MTFNYMCFVNIPTQMTQHFKGGNTDTLEVLSSPTVLRRNSTALVRGLAQGSKIEFVLTGCSSTTDSLILRVLMIHITNPSAEVHCSFLVVIKMEQEGK